MHQLGQGHCDGQYRSPEICWPALEYIIRNDPVGQSLASASDQGQLIGHGQLEAAALELAQHGEAIGIVTGLCAAGTDRPTAETDGLLGTLFLSKTLIGLGIDVTIITDSIAMSLLEAGCDHLEIDRELLLEFPFEPGSPNDPRRTSNAAENNPTTDAWVHAFLDGLGGRLTHLISIGRCGPSHKVESIVAQTDDPAQLEQFDQQVPNESRDLCHNMRGESINGFTAKTHRLFEILAERELPIITMAVGDSGNELGMGRFGWSLIRDVLAHKMPDAALAGRIPCRIAVDLPLVAGVSNWGAYAIAASLAALKNNHKLLNANRVTEQRELLNLLLDQGGDVDRVSGDLIATVNGIESDRYFSVLTDLLALCRGAC